jgi:hypothetical protein
VVLSALLLVAGEAGSMKMHTTIVLLRFLMVAKRLQEDLSTSEATHPLRMHHTAVKNHTGRLGPVMRVMEAVASI